MIAIAPIGTRPFASLAEPSVPPSGLTLAALEQLMRLLQELATAFPETQGWMKARIGSSGDDIQAYQRLIRESAAPFEKRDYIRCRDMPRALRGAESALDYLMKMEEGSDVTQNIDFCWMVISETMRILDNGDDSDGRAGGVIEKCMEYLEKTWIQHVLPSDNQAGESGLQPLAYRK